MTNKVTKTNVKDKRSTPYPRNDNSDQVCFKCGSTGHLKALCRTKVQSTNASATMDAPMEVGLN